MSFIDDKIFKTYLSHIKIDVNQFCIKISPALKRGVSRRNPKELIKSLQAVQAQMESEVFYSCLVATKTFLNSRDCHFGGKYQTKNFFCGLMRYVYPSALLDSFNKELDELIAETHLKVQSMAAEDTANNGGILAFGYKAAKFGLHVLTSYSGALLTIALAYQASRVFVANTIAKDDEFAMRNSEIFINLTASKFKEANIIYHDYLMSPDASKEIFNFEKNTLSCRNLNIDLLFRQNSSELNRFGLFAEENKVNKILEGVDNIFQKHPYLMIEDTHDHPFCTKYYNPNLSMVDELIKRIKLSNPHYQVVIFREGVFRYRNLPKEGVLLDDPVEGAIGILGQIALISYCNINKILHTDVVQFHLFQVMAALIYISKNTQAENLLLNMKLDELNIDLTNEYEMLLSIYQKLKNAHNPNSVFDHDFLPFLQQKSDRIHALRKVFCLFVERVIQAKLVPPTLAALYQKLLFNPLEEIAKMSIPDKEIVAKYIFDFFQQVKIDARNQRWYHFIKNYLKHSLHSRANVKAILVVGALHVHGLHALIEENDIFAPAQCNLRSELWPPEHKVCRAGMR